MAASHNGDNVILCSESKQQVPLRLRGIDEVCAVHKEHEQRLQAGMQVLHNIAS